MLKFKCSKCGKEFEVEEWIYNEIWTDRERFLLMCPDCWRERERKELAAFFEDPYGLEG